MMNSGGIEGSSRPVSWPSRTSVSASGKRIQTEISELNTDPPVDSSASPKGDNLYHWIATIIGPPGDTPAAVVAKCKLTIAMLSDPSAALSVVFDKHGALDQISSREKGILNIIDMPTVDAETSSKINEAITAKSTLSRSSSAGSQKPNEDG